MRTSCLRWMVQSWLPHEASLRRDWAPNGDVTLAEREGGARELYLSEPWVLC